jgi:hypothetical protein
MKPRLDAKTAAIFRKALHAMITADSPFIVAGAFAVNHYTGIWRNTKDLDLFVRPGDADAALAVLEGAGFDAYVQERHWLGKARLEDAVVDVIWGGGNWATSVDDHWFEHAEPGKVLGIDVPMAPAQDIILSKAYVAGRERYDGADISHLIRARGHHFDWDDLVRRFGDHWPLLLHYMILYRFVYPEAREHVPVDVIRELASRLGTADEIADGLAFRGLLVDRYAYLHDLRHEGRPDPGIPVAERAGYSADDVRRRRLQDAAHLDAGHVYRAHDMGAAERDHHDPLPVDLEAAGSGNGGGNGGNGGGNGESLEEIEAVEPAATTSRGGVAADY